MEVQTELAGVTHLFYVLNDLPPDLLRHITNHLFSVSERMRAVHALRVAAGCQLDKDSLHHSPHQRRPRRAAARSSQAIRRATMSSTL